MHPNHRTPAVKLSTKTSVDLHEGRTRTTVDGTCSTASEEQATTGRLLGTLYRLPGGEHFDVYFVGREEFVAVGHREDTRMISTFGTTLRAVMHTCIRSSDSGVEEPPR